MNRCEDCLRPFCRRCGIHYCGELCPCGNPDHNCDCDCGVFDVCAANSRQGERLMADLPAVTDQQLDEYEALVNAATPAPWSLWRQGQPAEVIDTEEQSIGRIWQRADAEFIAATRMAAPALVAEVRTLRSLVRDFLDPDPCSLDHHGYCQAHGWLAEGPCPHAMARQILDSLESTPSEQEAAATLARECTDHAAVILWCADRVRSVDDDPAVQDAADYLHSLSTRAQVDATPVTDRPSIIRWCAQQIHSMGGGADVERAAEYLDDLAVEAQEARDEEQAQANLDALVPLVDSLAAEAQQIHSMDGDYATDEAVSVRQEGEQRRCGYAKQHPSHTFMRLEVLFRCPGEHGTEGEL